ncbi:ATP-NAD kinase [Halorubrum sp. DTA46]|uniref:ATP-NAD kinase n=1 Tax=Halorubrum sp. DTA46 TaxID=3402162 RepID=UPI003AADD8AC
MGESIRRVAVVGDDARAATLRERVRTTGGRVVDTADASTDADALLAVGTNAIHDTFAHVSDTLVIPVGDRRYAFGTDDAAKVIGGLIDADGSVPVDEIDDVRRVTHPVLGVDAGAGTVYRAVADVALVAERPARISEFGIGDPGRREGSFRADGVVVATPFGSDGYANAAGGPVVEPGGGLAVVPVAPFSTRTGPRVVDGRVTLSVERDEEPVSLVVDGAARGPVEPDRSIRIETVARVAALAPASATRPRARRSETL